MDFKTAWNRLGNEMIAPKELPHTVPVVHRTLQVIQTIARSQGRANLTAKALAAETGIPSVTCYRILRTLMAHDWIRPIPGGGHELSLGLLTLVQQGQPLEGLIAVTRPELAKLAEKIELTVKLSIRRDDLAVALCRHESPMETSVSTREGATFPVAEGSSGAVLLSRLDTKEIAAILKRMPTTCWKHQTQQIVYDRLKFLKKNGYCVDAGIFNPSHYAISVPVLGLNDEVIASLTAIGFPNDLPNSRHPKLKKEMQLCANAITRRFRELNPTL